MNARQKARELVLAYGRNATSYQILNPGMELWFSANGDAVAGYASHHHIRVVAGEPVCAPERFAAVAREFHEDALHRGEHVVYFGAEQPALSPLRAAVRSTEDEAAELTAFRVGAQPVWSPAELVNAMRSHSSLRAQLNRAANKGLTVSEWTCDRAESSDALRRCLHEWLARRGLPPLHFLVEPETLPSLLDRHIFVGERDGEPVGFVLASPIRARNGWLIEQNVRGSRAPNGTAESMLFAAATWMAERGDRMITLGLSPLSRRGLTEGESIGADGDAPHIVTLLFAWLRAHGRRFYNFEGLDTFKAKFRPTEWEPVYAVVPPDVRVTRALLSMGAAFGGTTAAPFVARVLVHAVGQEAQRFRLLLGKRERRPAHEGTDRR